ncbi:MAG: hypothetical protein U0838_13590 [Chloroflexota bacterium]
MARVLVMVGTKKGRFLLESDEARRDWSVRGPAYEGFEIRDMAYDPVDGAIYAAAASPWFGRGLPLARPRRDVDALERGPAVSRGQRPGHASGRDARARLRLRRR